MIDKEIEDVVRKREMKISMLVFERKIGCLNPALFS